MTGDSIYLSYLDLAPVGICVIDPEYNVKIWNSCMEDWTLVKREEITGRDIRIFFTNFDGFICKRLEMIFEGGPPVILSSLLHKFYFQPKDPKRQNQSQQIIVSAIENNSASYDAFFAVQDVTNLQDRLIKYKNMKNQAVKELEERKKIEAELQKSLQEKEILYNELNHRVKNNLVMISSLINLQINNLQDYHAQQALSDINNKIMSIALVHEKLNVNSNIMFMQISEYLSNLASNIISSRSLTGNNIKLDLGLIDFEMPVNEGITLGMIVAELLTNSLKYAFKEKQGIIKISASIDRSGSLTIVYHDNGPGLPENFSIENSRSLGMKIITSLTLQLNGIVSFTNDKGLNAVLFFPMKNKSS